MWSGWWRRFNRCCGMIDEPNGTVAIVQARMGSSRLPGKVLKPILGRPMLAHLIQRLRLAKTIGRIVVATTNCSGDDPIESTARAQGIDCFRGSERDVLSRYAEAAKLFSAEVVVRVTADCPLIDPDVVDQAVLLYRSGATALDYVSNVLERSFPRGLDVEVFSPRLLEELFPVAFAPEEREHVTLYVARHRDRYRVAHFHADKDYSPYYLTVDSPEDFQLIEKIFETLYPHDPRFGWRDAVRLLTVHPEWREINRVQALYNEAKHRSLNRPL